MSAEVQTTTKEDPEMKKGRFSPEQIIGVLKQHEAGRKVQELAREMGVSEATIYTLEVEVRRDGCPRGTAAEESGG